MTTNPALSRIEFLESVVSLFNASNNNSSSSKAKAWHHLERYFRWNLDQGKASDLIIDEAQALDDEATLEEVRMLLNLQSDATFLVTVVLLGRPTLEELIARHAPLSQRDTHPLPSATPLPRRNSRSYVKSRLSAAGCRTVPFTRDAFNTMYTYTKGVPREINNLCDRSLLK